MSSPVLSLQEGDSPFTQNPARSFTMPARFYHDTEIYGLEKDAIFYCSWWYAGHKSRLTEPGSFITTSIHEQNVFVVRSKDGTLNGFYNVCQHRGHKLLEGEGKKSLIVCPYHAWSYDFDGQVRSARNSDNVADFDKCDFALKPVRVEEFCGMIFVNLDPDALSLKEQSGQLESEIRHYCPQVDDMVFAQRDTFNVEANWKVLIDNFLECYHCQSAHKDFVDLVDMNSYRSKVHDIYSSHCSQQARSNSNSAYTFETGEVDFGYAGWFLWPNLTLWIYPGEPNLSTLQIIPNGPQQTIEHQDWFTPSAQPSTQLKDAMVYQKDVLQPEDIRLCESVQEGLHSRGYNQGRFIVDKNQTELSEHAVHHFQKLVVNALGASLE